MGIFNFAKEAGQSLRNAIGLGGADEEDLARALAQNGVTLQKQSIQVKGSTVFVTGVADSQAEREKAILILGNTKGVDTVEDTIQVAAPQPVRQTAAPATGFPGGAQGGTVQPQAQPTVQPESKFYQVKPGDTLSKIAKTFYGDANKYQAIFQANTPMLKDPDEIYPGQVLRIPPQH